MTQDNGIPMVLHPEGWKLMWMNEEHGVLERDNGPPLSIGDKVEVVPRTAVQLRISMINSLSVEKECSLMCGIFPPEEKSSRSNIIPLIHFFSLSVDVDR